MQHIIKDATLTGTNFKKNLYAKCLKQKIRLITAHLK